MSKVSIQGDASGTGTLTIAAPNTNSNYTLTLPTNTGTVMTSASDVAASALTGDIAAARITDALNAGGSAPIYACRAWVNFNGTGTVAIRASGNVSSITDNGTGDFTVNFTNAMTDANYTTLVSSTQGTGAMSQAIRTASGASASPTTYTTSAVRISFRGSSSNTLFDASYCLCAVFR